MRISFAKTEFDASELQLGDTIIEQVHSFKLLGVTIQDNLSWSVHIDNIYRKTNQQLFLVRQLKRSGLNTQDLMTVYKTKIRPCLEYAAPVWATGITKAQSEMLESVQRRVVRIVFPLMTYDEALDECGCKTLKDRRNDMCKKLFDQMKMPNHPLNKLVKPYHREPTHQLRHIRHFEGPRMTTERCKNSFVNFALYNFQ